MARVSKNTSEFYSLEAESAVIGSLLLKSDRFNDLEGIICTQDFYLVVHRYIFDGIAHFVQMNKALDILTLSEYFKEKGAVLDN